MYQLAENMRSLFYLPGILSDRERYTDCRPICSSRLGCLQPGSTFAPRCFAYAPFAERTSSHNSAILAMTGLLRSALNQCVPVTAITRITQSDGRQ